MKPVSAARALGWVSVGIGVTELLAPGWLQRNLLGTHGKSLLVQSMGVREIMSGMSILTEKQPSLQLKAGLWSRVVGDVVDLALLGLAGRRTSRPGGLLLGAGMVLGIMALDVFFARHVQRVPIPNGRHPTNARRAHEDQSYLRSS
jgi:hypothetical protein